MKDLTIGFIGLGLIGGFHCPGNKKKPQGRADHGIYEEPG